MDVTRFNFNGVSFPKPSKSFVQKQLTNIAENRAKFKKVDGVVCRSGSQMLDEMFEILDSGNKKTVKEFLKSVGKQYKNNQTVLKQNLAFLSGNTDVKTMKQILNTFV